MNQLKDMRILIDRLDFSQSARFCCVTFLKIGKMRALKNNGNILSSRPMPLLNLSFYSNPIDGLLNPSWRNSELALGHRNI